MGVHSLLMEKTGPIFRLRLPRDRTFVANYALAQGLLDEKCFAKSVSGPLEQIRNATKDGLFTTYPGEHNFAIDQTLDLL